MDVDGGSSWATSERTRARLMETGRAAIYATRGIRRYGRLHQLRSRRPCGSAGRRCPSLAVRRRRSWICWGIRTTRCLPSGPARDVCVLVMSEYYRVSSVLLPLASAGPTKRGKLDLDTSTGPRDARGASSSQASPSNKAVGLRDSGSDIFLNLACKNAGLGWEPEMRSIASRPS